MRTISFIAPLHFAASTLAADPRLLLGRDYTCDQQMHFSTEITKGDATKTADFWNSLNATETLVDFFSHHFTTNWPSSLLGSAINCGNFPASSTCGPPPTDSSPCTYDPPINWYLQIAMANLYNTFVQWHEALQDSILKELAGGIQKITDDWGPPEPSSVDVTNMILGAVMTLSGFLDEEISGPIEQIMGVFDYLLEQVGDSVAGDPSELDRDLTKALGEIFGLVKSQLETEVNTLFGVKQDCTGIQCEIHNSKRVVLDPHSNPVVQALANGAYLDSTIVNKATAEWIKAAQDLMNEALVVFALQDTKNERGGTQYVLRIAAGDSGSSEGDCKGNPWTVWDSTDGCYGFATFSSLDTLQNIEYYSFFTADQFAKAKDVFRDTDQALANAIACHKSGGSATEYSNPDWNALSTAYPTCFFSLTPFQDSMN